MRLSKGFEVEMYTGTPTGTVVGLSDQIVANLSGFVREPDSRNVEYTTAPLQCYERLLCELVQPRLKLRRYLTTLGDYTLIPGSTLSLEESDRFYRSDPHNPYHTYIEQTYGTNVVTASIPNLRHVVSVIFSHSSGQSEAEAGGLLASFRTLRARGPRGGQEAASDSTEVEQSMEIDQVSDGKTIKHQ